MTLSHFPSRLDDGPNLIACEVVSIRAGIAFAVVASMVLWGAIIWGAAWVFG